MPKYQLPASIASHVLTAGPGKAVLPFIMCTTYCVPAYLIMANTRVKVTLGAASKPTIKTGAACPGHLPSEHLDPTLTAVASAGQPTAAGAGSMCGDLTANSIKAIPTPTSFSGMCSEGYSAGTSLLTLLVRGCTTYGFKVIKPTQPDSEDPAQPPAGAGPPYTLMLNAAKTNVTSCKDKSGATLTGTNFLTCLKDAAYSSFFHFAAGRVIIK